MNPATPRSSFNDTPPIFTCNCLKNTTFAVEENCTWLRYLSLPAEQRSILITNLERLRRRFISSQTNKKNLLCKLQWNFECWRLREQLSTMPRNEASTRITHDRWMQFLTLHGPDTVMVQSACELISKWLDLAYEVETLQMVEDPGDLFSYLLKPFSLMNANTPQWTTFVKMNTRIQDFRQRDCFDGAKFGIYNTSKQRQELLQGHGKERLSQKEAHQLMNSLKIFIWSVQGTQDVTSELKQQCLWSCFTPESNYITGPSQTYICGHLFKDSDSQALLNPGLPLTLACVNAIGGLIWRHFLQTIASAPPTVWLQAVDFQENNVVQQIPRLLNHAMNVYAHHRRSIPPCAKVYLPVMINKFHWALLTIDPRRRSLIVYDPTRQLSTDNAINVGNALARWFRDFPMVPPFDSKDLKIHGDDMRLQIAPYDVGVALLDTATHLLLGTTRNEEAPRLLRLLWHTILKDPSCLSPSLKSERQVFPTILPTAVLSRQIVPVATDSPTAAKRRSYALGVQRRVDPAVSHAIVPATAIVLTTASAQAVSTAVAAVVRPAIVEPLITRSFPPIVEIPSLVTVPRALQSLPLPGQQQKSASHYGIAMLAASTMLSEIDDGHLVGRAAEINAGMQQEKENATSNEGGQVEMDLDEADVEIQAATHIIASPGLAVAELFVVATTATESSQRETRAYAPLSLDPLQSVRKKARTDVNAAPAATDIVPSEKLVVADVENAVSEAVEMEISHDGSVEPESLTRTVVQGIQPFPISAACSKPALPLQQSVALPASPVSRKKPRTQGTNRAATVAQAAVSDGSLIPESAGASATPIQHQSMQTNTPVVHNCSPQGMDTTSKSSNLVTSSSSENICLPSTLPRLPPEIVSVGITARKKCRKSDENKGTRVPMDDVRSEFKYGLESELTSGLLLDVPEYPQARRLETCETVARHNHLMEGSIQCDAVVNSLEQQVRSARELRSRPFSEMHWQIVANRDQLKSLRERWWNHFTKMETQPKKNLQDSWKKTFAHGKSPQFRLVGNDPLESTLVNDTIAEIHSIMRTMQIDTEKCKNPVTISFVRSEKGAEAQTLHFDIPSTDMFSPDKSKKADRVKLAPLCYTCILHISPDATQGTWVPIRSAKEMECLFLTDRNGSDRKQLEEQLCVRDNFMSHPMQAGDLLVLRGDTAHFGPANPGKSDRLILVITFSPEELVNQSVQQERLRFSFETKSKKH